MYIDKYIFKRYWDIVKRDKNDKTHTDEDLNTYYSLFRNVEKEVFIEAIKLVLLNLSYFPRIDELNNCIQAARNKLTIKKWECAKREALTKDEEIELKKDLERK